MSRIEAIGHTPSVAWMPSTEAPRPTPRGLAAVRDSIARHPNATLDVVRAVQDTEGTARIVTGALSGEARALQQGIKASHTEQNRTLDAVQAAAKRRTRWGQLATIGQFFSTASMVATGLTVGGVSGIGLVAAGSSLLLYHAFRQSGIFRPPEQLDNALSVASLVVGVGGSALAARALFLHEGAQVVEKIHSIATGVMSLGARAGGAFASRDYGNATATLTEQRGAATDLSLKMSTLLREPATLMGVVEEATRVAREAIETGAPK